ncbi:MAG: hypothetical protein LBD02_03455 [Christensenellaceae bacterium]|nr:hypothetical protein [Christensenellaceae bacterium]
MALRLALSLARHEKRPSKWLEFSLIQGAVLLCRLEFAVRDAMGAIWLKQLRRPGRVSVSGAQIDWLSLGRCPPFRPVSVALLWARPPWRPSLLDGRRCAC